MFGGLYIEMVVFKVLGKWVFGSGWLEALINAIVVLLGVVNFFLIVSYII